MKFFEQVHPGKSWAYSFEKEGTKVVFATDNEIDMLLPDKRAPIDDPAAERAVPDELVKFCEGADLLVADGQYTDEEYPAHYGWGHSSVAHAVGFAARANAGRTLLFHHDPLHSDADLDAILEDARRRWFEAGHGADSLGVAAEGDEITVAAPRPSVSHVR